MDFVLDRANTGSSSRASPVENIEIPGHNQQLKHRNVAFNPVVRLDEEEEINADEEADRRGGHVNLAFAADKENDVENQDTVTDLPRARAGSKDFGERRRHNFSIGPISATSTEDLYRPHEGLWDKLRRVSTKESLQSMFRGRSPSGVSISSSERNRLSRRTSAENSFVNLREFNGVELKEYERSINERAAQLHRGASHPVFEITDEDAQSERSRATPLVTRRPVRVSTVSYSRVHDKLRRTSFGYAAMETLPNLANYGHEPGQKARPTLDDLRKSKVEDETELVRNTGNERNFPGGQLGWIQGVVLWTLQDMWAVQLFLRIPWMTAQAGVGLYTLVVVISTLIVLLTTLSTSAVATNGEIGVGGTYFMIARSLGPHFGAGIGVIFALANVINMALNIQGFADLIVSIMRTFGAVMIDRLSDTRIVAVLGVVGITLFALLGMVVASRVKILCLLLLIAGVLNALIGSFIPPNMEQQAKGFVGPSAELFVENSWPYFKEDQFGQQDFLTVFAVFFPSITGILAGTSITGDLKDPATAIPKGTVVATLIAAAVYLLVGWVSAAVNLRNASGSVTDLLAGNLTSCASNRNCTNGLINDMEILAVNSHIRPIFVAAALAATISTAIGNVHFAPKVFQALCRDKIFPFIGFFGKGYGKHDEPYRGYFLVMLIAIIFLMPSDFNFISNIVSNSFLLTYALINYATFNASFSKSPGWRPMFPYYNQWLSLASAAICLAFMFALDWKSAIVAFGFISVLWLYVFYKKPEVNWGTSLEATAYQTSLNNVLKLQKVQDHVKNFRPQILVLTGLPIVRPGLVYLANSITQGSGLLICGHVAVDDQLTDWRVLEQEIYKWFRKHKIRAFYEYYRAENTSEGIRALIQTCGLGKLRPNILMMGFHEKWTEMTPDSLNEYVGVIDFAFDSGRGVIVACAKEGFDLSEVVNFHQIVRENAVEEDAATQADDNDLEKGVPLEFKEPTDSTLMDRMQLANFLEAGRKKRIDGDIHVWWLYDDGGLTMLIPHLMSKHSPWIGSKIKVFCLNDKHTSLEDARLNMLRLLNKVRIKVSDVIPISLEEPPSRSAVEKFGSVLDQYRNHESRQNPHQVTVPVITEDIMREISSRTQKQIRLCEMLREHSSNSALNIISLPTPQVATSATLYMALLETMTRDMPITLLIRGNQEDVLAYSI